MYRRLHQLELLNLSYNRLSGVMDVQPLRRMKVLYLRSNRVSSLVPLASLPSLHSLDLECNALASLDALLPLWGMAQLTELRLRGNMIPEATYRRACRMQLPALRRLDGLVIHPASGSNSGARSPTALLTNPKERSLASQPEVPQAQRALQAAFAAEMVSSRGQSLASREAPPEPAVSPAQLQARDEPATASEVHASPTAIPPSPSSPPPIPAGAATHEDVSDAMCALEPEVLPGASAKSEADVDRAPAGELLRGLPQVFMDAASAAAAEADTAVASWNVESTVVRSELHRLETEHLESEARHQRELSACARSAALQVRKSPATRSEVPGA